MIAKNEGVFQSPFLQIAAWNFAKQNFQNFVKHQNNVKKI